MADVLHPELEAKIRGLFGFPPRIVNEKIENIYEKTEELRMKVRGDSPLPLPPGFPPPLVPPPPAFRQSSRFEFNKG